MKTVPICRHQQTGESRIACLRVGMLLADMIRLKVTAIGLAILCASNGAVYFVLKKSMRPRRDMAETIAKIEQAPEPFVLVIGDSLTQNAKLPANICNHQIINAGVGGARTSAFIPFAEEMSAKGIKPSLVVVALGLNDTVHNYETSFGPTYSLLLGDLPSTKVALATLAPVDLSGSNGKIIDPDKYKTVDAMIRSTALERHLPLIELGNIENFQTVDGVHPTNDSYVKWKAPMIEAIRKEVCD